MKFTNISFDSKKKDLTEFKTKLELFYNETEGIKPTNEDKKKTQKTKNVY